MRLTSRTPLHSAARPVAADGVHAVQLELAQLTYMDEDPPFGFRQDLASAIRPVLRGVIDADGNSPFWDAIAGRFFGMNFHNMPELDWRYGYPASLAVMLATAVLPYLYFKRRGWI